MKRDNESEWIDPISTPEREILDLRLIGMKHALTLGHLQYHRASEPLAEQSHAHWPVLVFLLSGQQRYLIDGREVAVHGGQMLLIPPGCRYGTGAWPELKGDLAWLILRVRPLPDSPALGMSKAGARAVFEALMDPSAPLVHPMAEEAAALVESAFSWWRHRDMALARDDPQPCVNPGDGRGGGRRHADIHLRGTGERFSDSRDVALDGRAFRRDAIDG